MLLTISAAQWNKLRNSRTGSALALFCMSCRMPVHMMQTDSNHHTVFSWQLHVSSNTVTHTRQYCTVSNNLESLQRQTQGMLPVNPEQFTCSVLAACTDACYASEGISNEREGGASFYTANEHKLFVFPYSRHLHVLMHMVLIFMTDTVSRSYRAAYMATAN